MATIVRPAEERVYRPWDCPKQAAPKACPPVPRSLTGSLPTFSSEPVQCSKGDPPVPVTHISLMLTNEVLPDPSKGPILVSIVDGSKGKTVQKKVDRSMKVAELKAQFLQEMPDLQWLSLSCNGKPLQEHDVLENLPLGHKVTLVTFQKCHGG